MSRLVKVLTIIKKLIPNNSINYILNQSNLKFRNLILMAKMKIYYIITYPRLE